MELPGVGRDQAVNIMSPIERSVEAIRQAQIRRKWTIKRRCMKAE